MNMDLSSILPLLMNKNKSGDSAADKSGGAETSSGNSDTMASLLSAVASGKPLDKTEMLTKLMPASGKGGNIAQMMAMANSMNSQKKQPSSPPSGFAPINSVASSDILGRLVKVMQKSSNNGYNNANHNNNGYNNANHNNNNGNSNANHNNNNNGYNNANHNNNNGNKPSK